MHRISLLPMVTTTCYFNLRFRSLLSDHPLQSLTQRDHRSSRAIIEVLRYVESNEVRQRRRIRSDVCTICGVFKNNCKTIPRIRNFYSFKDETTTEILQVSLPRTPSNCTSFPRSFYFRAYFAFHFSLCITTFAYGPIFVNK